MVQREWSGWWLVWVIVGLRYKKSSFFKPEIWGLRYRISIIYYILQASTTRQVNYDIHISLSNIHPNHDHHDQGSPKLTLKDKRLNP